MYQDPSTIVHPTVAGRTRKPAVWIIVAGVVLLILCICLASAAALLYFDPFNWGVVDRLLGKHDSIARITPADADLLISVDMLRFLSPDTDKVINAFIANSGDPEIVDRQAMMDDLDKNLLEGYGITLKDDVLPWIGQYAGFVILSIQPGSDASTTAADWVFVIEARDKKAADAFISKLTAFIAEDSGTPFQTREHQGTTIYENDGATTPDGLALARYKGYILFSDKSGGIIKMIDDQAGALLADDATFKALFAELPAERLVSGFISPEIYEELQTLSTDQTLSIVTGTNMNQKSSLALSLVDEGIKLDFVAAYDLQTLTQGQIDSLSAPGASGALASSMPNQSVFFLTGKDLSQTWSSIRGTIQESTGSNSTEFNESMQLLEEQIGINPDTDLFPLLDGEWAIGIFQDENNTLATQLDMQLGLLSIFETSQPDLLKQNIQNLAENLVNMGVTSEEKIVGETTLYELSSFIFDEPLMAFGIRQNQLRLGTDSVRVGEGITAENSLAQKTAYMDAWKPFDKDMLPVLYVDIRGLVQSLGAAVADMDLSMIQPITTLAAASSPLNKNTKQWSLLFFVETQ